MSEKPSSSNVKEREMDATQPVDMSIKEAFGVSNTKLTPDEKANLFTSEGKHIRYYFYPTWRAQLGHLLLFFVTCYLTIVVSHWNSKIFVITGELFKINNQVYLLTLPWLVLIPMAVLGKIFLFIFDAKYIIDERGVEAQIGLVSLTLRQPRLRYEDIRGVEPQQNLWERIIGIGALLVGRSMEDVEIKMKGVSSPRAIQLLINSERDKRLKFLKKATGSNERTNVIYGD